MNKNLPGSRLLSVGILLTLTGGYLDAYTYVTRDGVFANAQTANIVKLAMSLEQANYARAFALLAPISSFVLGVLVALIIETHHTKYHIEHIRRSVLLIEILTLCLVSFQHNNTLANCMISFVCAMQMEAFKQFIGQNFTTTVSTGNLRKFIGFLYKAVLYREKENLKIAGIYFLIILTFMFGAFLGHRLSHQLGIIAVDIPVLLLVIATLIITYQRYRNKQLL